MADQAAKEAASYDPNSQAHVEPPQEPEQVRILAATTKSAIRQTMKKEWETSWKTDKHGRELFRVQRDTPSDQLSHHTDAKTTRSASVHTSIKSTRPIPTRASVDTEHKQLRHILLECRNWIEERHRMWAGKQPCSDIKQK